MSPDDHETRPVIALLTDFGLSDAYVGAMKGVIAGICPSALQLDITHEVPPQNVAAGAHLLESVVDVFPDHTVYLGVVDPGVGSERAAIAVRAAGRTFVGPDNGLFVPALRRLGRGSKGASGVPASTSGGNAGASGTTTSTSGARASRHAPTHRAVCIDASRYRRAQVSTTFHGRDIFAPIAAHAAAGVPLDELGTPHEAPLVELERPQPRRREDPESTFGRSHIEGEVVYVDHFGNLVTNVPGDWLAPEGSDDSDSEDVAGGDAEDICVHIAGQRIDGMVSSYVARPAGTLLLVVGSTGMLEVSESMGSAAERLGAGAGEPILLTFDPTPELDRSTERD